MFERVRSASSSRMNVDGLTPVTLKPTSAASFGCMSSRISIWFESLDGAPGLNSISEPGPAGAAPSHAASAVRNRTGSRNNTGTRGMGDLGKGGRLQGMERGARDSPRANTPDRREWDHPGCSKGSSPEARALRLPLPRRATPGSPCLLRHPAVDHPRRAVAVDTHAEPLGPEGLVDRHGHLAALGERRKDALRFRGVVH